MVILCSLLNQLECIVVSQIPTYANVCISNSTILCRWWRSVTYGMHIPK